MYRNQNYGNCKQKDTYNIASRNNTGTSKKLPRHDHRRKWVNKQGNRREKNRKNIQYAEKYISGKLEKKIIIRK